MISWGLRNTKRYLVHGLPLIVDCTLVPSRFFVDAGCGQLRAHMLEVRMQIRVRRLSFAGWSIVSAEGSMCFPNSSGRPQVARLAVPPFAWHSPAANLKCPATRCLPRSGR